MDNRYLQMDITVVQGLKDINTLVQMSYGSEGSEPAINVGTESDDAMPIIDVKIESLIQNYID